MTIIKKNHLFPTMFDDFFTRDLWNWNTDNHSSTKTTIPAVNVKESDKNFQVEVAAPGMSKEDFKIELESNLLTISSEKQSEKEVKEEEKYTKKEFSYQSFQRSFQLPKEVIDIENIEAKYENGVLYLLIPKKEEVKQKTSRTIKIA